ncbi:MAG: aminoglycoside 6-adenylyltransferase [Nodosilinea sp.]
MRSEQELLDLILTTAKIDERIRAVILSGSRTNPTIPGDIFQDFDILYIVTDIVPFIDNQKWIQRFGELIIVQMPDAMYDPPPADDGSFAYLMLFTDGNRIDLKLFPLTKLDTLKLDSLSVLLLDKDDRFSPLPPPSDSDYLLSVPTAQGFSDCCNEFWWVCPGVAKGLWREELPYVKHIFERFVREQLMKMLTWYVGSKTEFSRSLGKFGKYLQQCLEPALWEMFEQTFADTSYEHMWEALFTTCVLFRITATAVAEQCSFAYPYGDDEKVSAYLRQVRRLPKAAKELE